MPTITSPSNPKIKQLRALRQRKQRDATGLFLVEGIYHVGEAVAAGAGVEYICYAPDLLSSSFARELVAQQTALGVPCHATTPQIFASLAEKENPQGILAVVRKRQLTLERLTPESFPWGVALVAPQDPGNVGAILRSIDAVGASGLLLLDSSVDPYHPGAVRASMGALFWFPVVAAPFADFAQWARRRGYHIYGASAHGSADYRSMTHYQFPGILLLGSEREGLSAEQAAVCDHLIRLPMKGRVSSLNLAVAAGILLYAMAESVG
ncbi:MAG TPA: RNA methyltransferase [Anaerolineales bacterium]|nr:RNA methyltransferase [Anaerolineales bacterium]